MNGPPDRLPVLVRRLKQVVEIFDHSPNHIGAADHANQHAVTQDRDTFDPMFQHQISQLRKRGFLISGDDGRAHNFPDVPLVEADFREELRASFSPSASIRSHCARLL